MPRATAVGRMEGRYHDSGKLARLASEKGDRVSVPGQRHSRRHSTNRVTSTVGTLDSKHEQFLHVVIGHLHGMQYNHFRHFRGTDSCGICFCFACPRTTSVIPASEIATLYLPLHGPQSTYAPSLTSEGLIPISLFVLGSQKRALVMATSLRDHTRSR